MKTFRTFYRLAVMAMTLAVAWMAWQLYGPPPEKQQWLKQRGIELADSLLDRFRDGGTEGALNFNDPRNQPLSAPAPFSQPGAQPLLSPVPNESDSIAADVSLVPQVGSTAPPRTAIPAGPMDSEVQPAGYVAPAAASSAASDQSRLEQLIGQLEQTGVTHPRLETWGASGEYFRFSCRAPWHGESSYSRHFESVAADPTAAVQQVATAIKAWRASNENGVPVR